MMDSCHVIAIPNVVENQGRIFPLALNCFSLLFFIHWVSKQSRLRHKSKTHVLGYTGKADIAPYNVWLMHEVTNKCL